MSTAAVSSNSLYQQLQSFYQQRQSDLQQLGQALQSGDLSGAQTAFNALQTLGQSGPFANADSFHNSQREQDFAAIGQALQSGDIAGAQQAFASLEQTFGRQSQSSNPASSTGPAVVVNLGGSSGAGALPTTGGSSGGPEIIINLGANTGPEQLTIEVNNAGNSGAEQLSISLGSQQNPTAQGEVSLNISPNSNEQIIINLLNGQASSPSPTSNGLSVVA